METEQRNNHFVTCVASRFALETYSANPNYALSGGKLRIGV
ncbi:hypothetical protein GXM_01417 [Nostoc sphaeroides CCNUC1]|uniref:Uncharacterized protein n=1 Tax=Nostoc sphaeroides CCNUC1 TaxID=2653204 RepID=A0A5P8VUB8_9NOSO|nr:hypothetical protein GXM_01417 [Nostoc sphaeroides CCNUC1]